MHLMKPSDFYFFFKPGVFKICWGAFLLHDTSLDKHLPPGSTAEVDRLAEEITVKRFSSDVPLNVAEPLQKVGTRK